MFEISKLNRTTSSIRNCEKMQLKFEEGSSQHSLLQSRMKALQISQAVITRDETLQEYAREEIMKAITPISSIISKSDKGQRKYAEGTSTYTRFQNILRAMYVARDLLNEEFAKRNV
ncbi:hypothetical protein P6P90_10230 [Ectobacillus antri]|uniref:Uncharacterized protein n=1 Tax=Ectobacillus antri TaxID=2486280 RepID=A0ABT6H798_9BACI|nr:hypothetical protein [Ectobacillus antri]MDG4657302.1 hypothetical protein [Ectobacillus antri]MDG5754346.1 hypothetical protein [Ectobacillus antri]